MDKEMKLMEFKAKKLAGNKVKITMRKAPALGMEFSPFSVDVLLNSVSKGFLNVKKQTGMDYNIPIKDAYFVVEDIVLC
jgi:hypothetical protein